MVGAERSGTVIETDRLRLVAMLAVARETMLRDRLAAVRELERIRAQAQARFDLTDELVIACDRSLLEVDTQSTSAANRLARLRELDERAGKALPETNRERRSVANFVASALRRVDRAAGIAAYREELDLRERLYGNKDHRSVRYSRLNLCHALRSYGASVADLVEAHEIVRAEWQSRRAEFGDDNSFTWMAAQAYVQNALAAARCGHPLESPDALVTHATAVVEARQRLLGTSHRRTLYARITLADARGAAGQREQAVWSLLALRAEVDAVGLDEAERIPLLLMEYLLDAADAEDRRAAADYGREAREHLLPIYGADHPMVVDVEERIGRIMASVGP